MAGFVGFLLFGDLDVDSLFCFWEPYSVGNNSDKGMDVLPPFSSLSSRADLEMDENIPPPFFFLVGVVLLVSVSLFDNNVVFVLVVGDGSADDD